MVVVIVKTGGQEIDRSRKVVRRDRLLKTEELIDFWSRRPALPFYIVNLLNVTRLCPSLATVLTYFELRTTSSLYIANVAELHCTYSAVYPVGRN